VNSKLICSAKGIREPLAWDASKLAIRVGVNYTGLMDEDAVFDRHVAGAVRGSSSVADRARM
jgi:hypothetical protein